MKKTITLVIIAIVIGAYMYFVEIKGSEERQKLKETNEKLVDFQMDSLQAITIRLPNETYAFNKIGDMWQINSPIQTLGDESNISSLINNIKNAKKNRTFTVKKNELGTFGLAAEQAIRIKLETKAGDILNITFGEDTNIGSNAYVALTDTLVATIPASVKNSVNHDLFYWRDKKIIHFEKNDIKEFSLNNPHGKFVFKKDGRDWILTQPLQLKADQSKVDAILNKFNYQNIKEVVEDNPKGISRYGLTNPAYILELVTKEEKEKLNIVFSKQRDGMVYGKTSGRNYVFTLDTTAISPMNKNLYVYRDKSIIKIDDKKVDRINLLYNDVLNKLSKDSLNIWFGSNMQKTKDEKVNSILLTLNNLKAAEFVEEKAYYFKQYGLLNPRGKIEIYSGDNKLVELDFGIISKGKVFVRNPVNKRVIKINESEIENLFPSNSDLYEEKKEENTDK